MKFKLLKVLFWVLFSMVFIGLFGALILFYLVDSGLVERSTRTGNIFLCCILVHVIGYFIFLIDAKYC